MPREPKDVLGQPTPLKQAAFMTARASPVVFMHYNA